MSVCFARGAFSPRAPSMNKYKGTHTMCIFKPQESPSIFVFIINSVCRISKATSMLLCAYIYCVFNMYIHTQTVLDPN